MKCSNCKKNYKDNLAMCPKCGEANSKLLEDKTMAIMEVNEDLSLTAMISNQIDEFNEDNNEEIVKEDKKDNKGNSKKKKVTKNNSMMAFGVIEDIFGTAELLVFPKVYEKYAGLLMPENIVVITGRLSIREDDTPKILPEEVFTPDEYKAKINNSSNNVNDFKFLIDSEKKDKVISFAKYFYGKTHVTFYDKNTKNEIWSGYMNTSKEILNELKYIIHNS
jgi:DNA polymerase III alpha subunit